MSVKQPIVLRNKKSTLRDDSGKDISIPIDSWCVTDVKKINISFLWTIKNFSYYSEHVDLLESSSFPTNMSKGSRWVINLYPRGEKYSNSGYGFTTVFLKLVKSSVRDIKANFKFCVIANDGNKTKTMPSEKAENFRESYSHGFYKFIERDILFDQSKRLLHNDTLKLYCEITIVHDVVNVSSSERKADLAESSASILLKDLGDLVDDSLFSDVILNVNGNLMRAHKAILSARSPVFAAMFKHKMKESIQNIVKIRDISHETMKNVIIFIYTGKIPNLVAMADSLLSAADKYGLEDLKRMCEDVLESTITVKNSSDLLLLADTHNANHLKSYAIDFINDNGSSVRNTDGWENIVNRAPHLVIELYSTLFEQNS